MFKVKNAYMNPKGVYTITEGTANLYRIYKNPKAKDLFIKAQNTESVEERIKLFEEMGEYKIVNKKPKASRNYRFLQFLKGIFSGS